MEPSIFIVSDVGKRCRTWLESCRLGKIAPGAFVLAMILNLRRAAKSGRRTTFGDMEDRRWRKARRMMAEHSHLDDIENVICPKCFGCCDQSPGECYVCDSEGEVHPASARVFSFELDKIHSNHAAMEYLAIVARVMGW